MPNTPRPTPPLATLALAALCVLTPAAAPAAAQPKPAVTDWPARPNTATSGSFSVVQAATDDTARFMAEWNKPTQGVKVPTTTHIQRGRPLDTFIAFRGCRADKTGKCTVTATFDLRDPSGKVVRVPTMEVWPNQPQPPPGIIQVSRKSMAMTFGPDDALGTYTVRAAVTDRVASVTLHTQQDITVSN